MSATGMGMTAVLKSALGAPVVAVARHCAGSLFRHIFRAAKKTLVARRLVNLIQGWREQKGVNANKKIMFGHTQEAYNLAGTTSPAFPFQSRLNTVCKTGDAVETSLVTWH